MFAHTLNGFKYCYLTLIILFNINCLFAHRLNCFKYCYLSLIILFSIKYLPTVKWFQVSLSQHNWPSVTVFWHLLNKWCLCNSLPREQIEEYFQNNRIGARAWHVFMIDRTDPSTTARLAKWVPKWSVSGRVVPWVECLSITGPQSGLQAQSTD